MLNSPTPITPDVYEYLLEVRHKHKQLREVIRKRTGAEWELTAERRKQIDMIRQRIADYGKFGVKAIITEQERIDVANFAQFLVETFHDMLGTPLEKRPRKESHAQTFFG